MRKNANPPVYSQVAYDIASKIAAGELSENTKFTGRSLMSTEYSVSQETIRRALKQLADLDIITIQQNRGAVVTSRRNAVEYIEKFRCEKDSRLLRHELRSLMAQREEIDCRITELVEQITDLNDRFTRSDPLRNYEFEIQPSSGLVGKSIRQLEFWQQTGATIVAIRSEGKIILSPGPNAVLHAFDILVVTGNPSVLERVKQFIE